MDKIDQYIKELNNILNVIEEMEYDANIDIIVKSCLHFIMMLENIKDSNLYELKNLLIKDIDEFLKVLKNELIKDGYPELQKLKCLQTIES